MQDWRLKAEQTALEAFSLPVLDGTPEGEAWIDEHVIDPTWDPDHRERYRDGKHNWCGDFLAYCWRAAGFRCPAVLSSVGRILYPYARYDVRAKTGPHWCVVLGANGVREAKLVRDVHEQADDAGMPEAMRFAARLEVDPYVEVQPGDAFLFQAKPNGWNGHVMMALARSGANLTVVDGNGSSSFGPRGEPGARGHYAYRQRDGVGIRTVHLPTLAEIGALWLVRPSALDFSDAILSYHPSMAAAVKAAGEEP